MIWITPKVCTALHLWH